MFVCKRPSSEMRQCASNSERSATNPKINTKNSPLGILLLDNRGGEPSEAYVIRYAVEQCGAFRMPSHLVAVCCVEVC